ncbi:MAG: STAS domain-containing protein [Armatimonadota bacterium]|nr:STAS domain-containing protein [Armatimonadota bacterium]
MEMDLGVDVTMDGNLGIIRLTGELDAYTSSRFKEVMINTLEKGCTNLVVSLADVEYIDSSGLGALVGGLKRVSERSGKLVLVGARPQVRKVFEITGLEKVFPIYRNESEAVESLKRDESQ